MKSKNSNRYAVPESENYEPGSNDTVLKNYLGIKTQSEIEALEAEELERTELELAKIFGKNTLFSKNDICNIHELWLGDIYPFAGKYRTVNMHKDGFPFCNPNLIAVHMEKFEKEYLNTYTPCHYSNLNELAHAIGIVHVEFILIHPFREGNGRVARLLAYLMGLQAERPPLDFTPIDQTVDYEGFKNYILAIHAGFEGNYMPIQKIFRNILLLS